MTFNPQQLTNQLNHDSAFRERFNQNPQAALQELDLTMSDDVAILLAEQMTMGNRIIDDTVLGCTRN